MQFQSSVGRNVMKVFPYLSKMFFAEINELIAESAINIDGEIIKLDFFLGGDYKVYQNLKFVKCSGHFIQAGLDKKLHQI